MKFISQLSIFVSVLELVFELVIAILGQLNLYLDNYYKQGVILWWAMYAFLFSLLVFDIYFTIKKKYLLTNAIIRVIKLLFVFILSALYFNHIHTLNVQDWIHRLRDVFKYLVNENDKYHQQEKDV